MFDENQLVDVKWYSGNKKYYIDLGYTFTKMGDIFQVPFKMLLHKSKAKIKVICEYGGEEFITTYGNYKTSKSRGKIACENCKQKKIADTLLSKYGSTSLWGSKELRDKAKESMKNKYGCEYAMQTIESQEKFKQTMIKKYGYENPSYCPELQAKAKESMYNNGTVPTSVPEQKIVKMLIELYGTDNCYPGYPVDRINLDCLLIVNNIKIDVEYDGWYWHKDTKDYDRKRNHWLIAKGYKILRIKGNKNDEIPSIFRLKEEVDYILNNHDIGYIDMNN